MSPNNAANDNDSLHRRREGVRPQNLDSEEQQANEAYEKSPHNWQEYLENVNLWSQYLSGYSPRYDTWSKAHPWKNYFVMVLVKYFVVAPILAPYYTARSLYYKAQYIYQAGVFLYPALRRLSLWLWKLLEWYRGRQEVSMNPRSGSVGAEWEQGQRYGQGWRQHAKQKLYPDLSESHRQS
ncbi:hypothetical protein Ddc_09916 [Ditylenchus destructor]|nr:hypothetical protein Ddc_09916 [Ditylenchus destructor]